MNSYTKLFKNSIIFAIGNLGSKLVSILLVPLYTYYLSTGEYGAVDLIITTTNMLVPVVSLSMADAAMRFAMDKSYSHKETFTNTILISLLGFLISLLLYPIFVYFNIFGNYLLLFYMYLLFNMLSIVMAQYLRGIGQTKRFALNGIILTLVTGILNILFIVNLGMGVYGYLVSLVLANLISIVYLTISINFYKTFSFKDTNIIMQKSLIKYSFPLIPTSLMWSAINSSSRYIILFFLGVGSNGLFAVASKIPLVINIASQIFSQAWQISAIEESESTDSSKLYENVFQFLSTGLFFSSLLIMMILKPLFSNLFSEDYFLAWTVSPFLLLGAIFSSFSNFLGATYIAKKQTIGVFKTSIYGGLLSLIINVILIPMIGLVGAGISSMLSFMLMFYLRYRDTQKLNGMVIDWKRFNLSLLCIYTHIAILFLNYEYFIEALFSLVILIIFILINRDFILNILKLIFKKHY